MRDNTNAESQMPSLSAEQCKVMQCFKSRVSNAEPWPVQVKVMTQRYTLTACWHSPLVQFAYSHASKTYTQTDRRTNGGACADLCDWVACSSPGRGSGHHMCDTESAKWDRLTTSIGWGRRQVFQNLLPHAMEHPANVSET